jgi:hypothetical protein
MVVIEGERGERTGKQNLKACKATAPDIRFYYNNITVT